MKRAILLAPLFVFVFYLVGFSLTVQSIQCGTGVKNRKIMSPKSEFKVGEKVYCLTVLTDIKKPTYIIHRWVLDDRHFDVKLKVKPYKRFRTWSYKTIYPSMMGVWKLEVLDSDGNLLREKIFTVK